MQLNGESEPTRSTACSRPLGAVNCRRSGVSVRLAIILGFCVYAPVQLWCRALALEIFAPGIYERVEAPYNEYTPFSLPSSRCQQVFRASEFGAISSGGWINGIAFRMDTPAGFGFRRTLPNLQINLSTTARGPDQLSATFADNSGQNDTMVFGPSSALIEGFMTVGTPQCFDIYFYLPKPFFYDPTDGNLLMDLRLYQGQPLGVVPSFDAVNRVDDSISRVYGDIGAQAGFEDSSGLITKFYAIPVPEPSTLALSLCGAVLLGWWYRRKQIR